MQSSSPPKKLLMPAQRCLLTWKTPLGTMQAALTAQGVRYLEFPKTNMLYLPTPGEKQEPVLLLLERLEGNASLNEECLGMADTLTEFLRNYFERNRALHPPRLDWTGHGEFDKAVWTVATRIPFGQTRTYGELAHTIGRPSASRAVGGALGRNPLPLLVPCHRVISQAKGSRHWGGFSGGLDLKKWLLAHEELIPR